MVYIMLTGKQLSGPEPLAVNGDKPIKLIRVEYENLHRLVDYHILLPTSIALVNDNTAAGAKNAIREIIDQKNCNLWNDIN